MSYFSCHLIINMQVRIILIFPQGHNMGTVDIVGETVSCVDRKLTSGTSTH